MSEVKAKRLPEPDDDVRLRRSREFETMAELRDDIASRLPRREERAIEREYEQAALEAADGEAEIELPISWFTRAPTSSSSRR